MRFGGFCVMWKLLFCASQQVKAGKNSSEDYHKYYKRNCIELIVISVLNHLNKSDERIGCKFKETEKALYCSVFSAL